MSTDNPHDDPRHTTPGHQTSGHQTSGHQTSGHQTSGHDDFGTAEGRPASAPRSQGGSPTERFRQEVASKQVDSDESDEEQEIWEGGYSPKAMVGTWALLGVVSLVILVIAIMSESISLLVGLGVVLLIWVVAGLVYAWRRFGVHYELTTQRFVHQKGILTRQTDRIEVIDIDDVSFTQGPIERIFTVGTIVLTSSDRSHPVLSMIGIADVKHVAGLIDDIRRKERRRRSLHIEAI
jgi:membrane protein YdbS with pleckstrin-like domain